MALQVYVDADPIVYRDGYINEDHTYEVIAENTVTGTMHQMLFQSGPDKQAFFKENTAMACVESTRLVKPAPVSHALHTVKKTIGAIKAAIEEKYQREAELHLFLSGPDNFRVELATIKEYKGNRSQEKPFHYQAIRDYMYDRWAAEIVTGREADDEISILARKVSGVVATIDKDLDQIPGLHYDYKNKVHYNMEPWECTRYFYIQALAGDSGDNIGGCFRVGAKGAETMIDQWVEHWYEHTKDPYGPNGLENFLWARIVSTYLLSLERETAKLKCDYKDMVANGRSIEDIAIENARLVKMQDYAGQLWNPPGIADDLHEESMS